MLSGKAENILIIIIILVSSINNKETLSLDSFSFRYELSIMHSVKMNMTEGFAHRNCYCAAAAREPRIVICTLIQEVLHSILLAVLDANERVKVDIELYGSSACLTSPTKCTYKFFFYVRVCKHHTWNLLIYLFVLIIN